MTTYLICTDGTNGDVYPFVRLGQELARRGHETILYTHQHYVATAEQAGLRCVATDTEERYAIQLADGRHLVHNVLADVDNVVDFYTRNGVFDQIRAEYTAMADVVRHRPPGSVVVLGRHTSRLSVLMLREAYGVPAAWVAVSPAQFLALPVAERMIPASLGGPIDEMRAAAGLPPLTDWAGWLSTVDLLLALWPGWFDTAGPTSPPAATLTGFVLHDDGETGELPPGVADLVAGPEPPVLVTGGSSPLLHADWYRVAAEACARAGRRSILVCRHRGLLPDPLPDGAFWYPALPFRTLMPRVAAVVHHGGVLTGARAVASGVPQLVLAYGADRPDNARRLRRLGVAEWLPSVRWGPAEVTAQLRLVLDDPGYRRRAAALASSVDSAAAVAATCDRLESLGDRQCIPRPAVVSP